MAPHPHLCNLPQALARRLVSYRIGGAPASGHGGAFEEEEAGMQGELMRDRGGRALWEGAIWGQYIMGVKLKRVCFTCSSRYPLPSLRSSPHPLTCFTVPLSSARSSCIQWELRDSQSSVLVAGLCEWAGGS